METEVVLITGISSGFGLEAAQMLAEKGYRVYGTVRREAERIPGVHYLTADVRDADAVERAVAGVIASEGRIDMLVNNAGMGICGPIECTPDEEIELQMDTNFMGMVRFTRAALPHMRSRGEGKIVFVSSIGGLMGLPFQGFYSASKFAVEGYAEALRMEVHAFGISVSLINPGDFSTGFTGNRRKAASEAAAAYPAYLQSMGKIENDEGHGLKPVRVAETVVKIAESRHPGDRYVVATFEQRLSVLLKTLLPSSLFSRILRGYYRMDISTPETE